MERQDLRPGRLLSFTGTSLAFVLHAGCGGGGSSPAPAAAADAGVDAVDELVLVGDATPGDDAVEGGSSEGASTDAAVGQDAGALECSSGSHECNGACEPNSDEPSNPSDPCILAEQFGVFVSPGGSDSGSGTRTSPLKTLGRAMDVAVAGGTMRVYACSTAGSYTQDSLVVGASRDGVHVFGGLDCTSAPAIWAYVGSPRALVAPSSVGYALEVADLAMGVTFEDVGFVSQPTSSPGASSIAVFVTGAQNVTFRRVAMTAGSAAAAVGAAGASGGTSGNPSNHYAQSLDGKSSVANMAALLTTCTCPDGTSSIGSSGGDATHGAGLGRPSYGGGAAGTNGVPCNNTGAGGDGNDAPSGTPDVPSSALGSLSSFGWLPATGAAASDGAPGQGGGGGGDGDLGAGAGGGGSCGGCGGVGAKPGGGGGSSIALLSFQSNVSLVGCTLTASLAAAGGQGGDGEAGQGGGIFGNGDPPGCPGGLGGAGAGGNGAQGGPGGLSLGLGYSGPIPNVDATTAIRFGAAGSGGLAGTRGPAAGTAFGKTGADGAVGQPGVAQATLAL